MKLIDTHCHINQKDVFPKPGDTVREANEKGVNRLIVVGVDEASCRRAIELADEHHKVFAIVGLHPNYTAAYSKNDLLWIEELAKHPKAVAIGEIGLDYHWDYSPKDKQARALKEQLSLARRIGKPVVFHCRKAYSELLDVLEQVPPIPYLFHCFSGTREDATRAVKLDAYFGIDGPITYKNSQELRNLVNELPRERLVIETDSPYLTPHPHRGKPNSPAFLPLVNSGLAAALSLSSNECAELTTRNACRFFGI